MSQVKQKRFELVEVNHREVACDGGNPSVGHPLVYLHIGYDTNEATCPYCSRSFVYVEH